MLKFSAFLIGLYLAVPAAGIVISMLGAAGTALPAPVCVLILLLCTPAGAWSVLRGAASLERLIYNGCRIGIMGWLLTIAVFTVYRYSETKTSVLSETPFLFSVLNPITAQANVLICIVGWWLTRQSRSITSPGAANVNEAKRAPGPDPTRTVRIVTIELILGSALAAFIIWIRYIDPWVGLLVMLLAYPVMMLYLAMIVVGFVQGVRHLQGVRHRRLGALAVSVSVAPLVFAFYLYAIVPALRHGPVFVEASKPSLVRWAWVEMRNDDAPQAEQYRRVAQTVQSPPLFQYSYVEADTIVLVLAHEKRADSLEVHMKVSQVEALSRFCNESLVGEPLAVQIPAEESFMELPVNVTYQGLQVEQYWHQMVEDDAMNRQRLRRVASFMAPGSDEEARIGEQLRPIADKDGSSLLDEVETRAVERAMEFGLKAARLISVGATRSGVAKQTGVTVEDLDSRAREYNAFASQIQEAGIMDMPTVVLPEDPK